MNWELKLKINHRLKIFMSVAKCEASYVKKNQFLFQTSFDWFLPKQNSPNTRRKVFKTKSTTQKFKVIKNSVVLTTDIINKKRFEKILCLKEKAWNWTENLKYLGRTDYQFRNSTTEQKKLNFPIPDCKTKRSQSPN